MYIQVHVPPLLIPDHTEPALAQATTLEPVESDAIEVQACPNREEFPDVVLRSVQVHVPALFFPDHIEPFSAQATTLEPVESDAIELQVFPLVSFCCVHVHVPSLLIPDHMD